MSDSEEKVYPEIDMTSPETLLDSIYTFCIKYKDELIVDEMIYNIEYKTLKIYPTIEMVNKYPFLYLHFSIVQCIKFHPNWMNIYAAINLKQVFAVVYLYDSINGGTGNGDEIIRALGWSVQKTDALKWAKKLTEISNKYIPERIVEYMDKNKGQAIRCARFHNLPDEKCDQMISEFSECLNGLDVQKLLTFYGECTFDTPLTFKIVRLPVVDAIPSPSRDYDPDSHTIKWEWQNLPVPNNRQLYCVSNSHDFCDIDFEKPLAFFYNENEAKTWSEKYESDHKYHDTIITRLPELS